MNQREQVIAAMAETFQSCPADRLESLKAGEAPWDSLGHLRLLMALEMRTGKAIPADKFSELVTIDAIEQFLAS